MSVASVDRFVLLNDGANYFECQDLVWAMFCKYPPHLHPGLWDIETYWIPSRSGFDAHHKRDTSDTVPADYEVYVDKDPYTCDNYSYARHIPTDVVYELSVFGGSMRSQKEITDVFLCPAMRRQHFLDLDAVPAGCTYKIDVHGEDYKQEHLTVMPDWEGIVDDLVRGKAVNPLTEVIRREGGSAAVSPIIAAKIAAMREMLRVCPNGEDCADCRSNVGGGGFETAQFNLSTGDELF